MFNPLSYLFDLYRECLFNIGGDFIDNLLFATLQSVVIFIVGIFVFNKVEKSFIDTI
jgi:ABC-type polysaccharide/polyol phosphate export permease